ncbi:MAG TPA: hypothetical protein VNT79_17580 [Phycisphaerae bacterium]|nr:hypothetical protein [Phycisphaerae bacterium]
MPSKFPVVVAAALLFVTSVCVAQPPAEEKPPVDPQRPARAEPYGRAPRERPVMRFGSPDEQLALLTERLQLDEAQKAQIKPIIEAQHAKLREIREQHRRTPEEMQEWRKLREEMSAAAQARDTGRVDELRRLSRELNERRRAELAPAREATRQAEQALHDGINQVLRPDQKEKFEEVWKERLAPSRPMRDGGPRNPRALRQAIGSLSDLTPDQKRQIDALFDEHKNSMRRRPPAGEPGAPPHAPDRESRQKEIQDGQAKLFEDAMKALTPEQQLKVDEMLKQRAPNRRRPPRPGSEKPEQTEPPQDNSTDEPVPAQP